MDGKGAVLSSGYGMGQGKTSTWAGCLQSVNFPLAPKEGGPRGFLGDCPDGRLTESFHVLQVSASGLREEDDMP